MAGVRFAVPVIGAFGLRPGSEAAVQHHHQWRAIAQTLWPVQMEGSADPADIDGLGGLSDRDRLRARCSECVAATEASAEQPNRGSEEHGKECSKVSGSHAAIVAGATQIDKYLVKIHDSGTLMAHGRCRREVGADGAGAAESGGGVGSAALADGIRGRRPGRDPASASSRLGAAGGRRLACIGAG
ncbi:hypothetical protein GCM10009641_21000 [Mycobacterium cookii]|uniref:Uncharacterized protein n=1 Tax=Mycobacterium cookii TaxID=1775 RepID=A0A7I7KUA8_9MYCO|nr:hypothetical protein MCOO_13240 [Mycobacterium cookii]